MYSDIHSYVGYDIGRVCRSEVFSLVESVRYILSLCTTL